MYLVGQHIYMFLYTFTFISLLPLYKYLFKLVRRNNSVIYPRTRCTYFLCNKSFKTKQKDIRAVIVQSVYWLDCGLDERRVVFPCPPGVRDYYAVYTVQTLPENYVSSYKISTWGFLPIVKWSRRTGNHPSPSISKV